MCNFAKYYFNFVKDYAFIYENKIKQKVNLKNTILLMGKNRKIRKNTLYFNLLILNSEKFIIHKHFIIN
jgi:hypothetical protein